MRHHLIIARTLLSVGALATPVHADDAPCKVTIVRAPLGDKFGDVRATVETWVAAETRCGRALEVRIVATEDGLYVVARDDRGRLHERIVPNADSAGVLIASWAADDRFPEPARKPDAWVSDTTRELEAARPEPRLAPGEAAVTTSGRSPGASQPAATGPTRWLSVGGMFAMSGGGGSGVRTELDLTSRGAWTLGAAVSASESMLSPQLSTGIGSIATTDAKGIVYVARGGTLGPFELRAALGVGLVYTSANLTGLTLAGNPTNRSSAEDVFATAEAAIRVSYPLGRSWAVGFGPVITYYGQELNAETANAPMSYESVSFQRGLEVMGFAAIQHRM